LERRGNWQLAIGDPSTGSGQAAAATADGKTVAQLNGVAIGPWRLANGGGGR